VGLAGTLDLRHVSAVELDMTSPRQRLGEAAQFFAVEQVHVALLAGRDREMPEARRPEVLVVERGDAEAAKSRSFSVSSLAL
jgi:hypothetical protein